MNTTNEVNVSEVRPEEGSWFPISQIVVPEDARPHTPEDIDSRAASMAREGQLENILLSKEGDRLVLVYGHGRLESAKKLGWEKIRADIKEGLTENRTC
jgi:ParB-like chromosome segregation protein Spo0J